MILYILLICTQEIIILTQKIINVQLLKSKFVLRRICSSVKIKQFNMLTQKLTSEHAPEKWSGTTSVSMETISKK